MHVVIRLITEGCPHLFRATNWTAVAEEGSSGLHHHCVKRCRISHKVVSILFPLFRIAYIVVVFMHHYLPSFEDPRLPT